MSQQVFKSALPLELKWKNLSLIQKQKNKVILNNLDGAVRSGDFLTIMGSSGAGKSSFLSLITKTESSYKNFVKKGKITLNQSPYTEEQFFSIASYVSQEDIFLETLTIEQVFDFQAKLKLYGKSDQEKKQRIMHILKLLNLYEVRKSYIGGLFKKSISGGQKKRLSIGIELLSDPQCLILDQPTSGLDSHNSLIIIELLFKLAKEQNKLIITTLHQPSSRMFQKFDKLMVLHKGRTIYFDQASTLVPYMQKLEISVDYRMNPTDFLMLQISSYKEQNQQHITKMTSQNFIQYKKNQKSQIILQQQKYEKINFKIQKSVPFTDQFKPLIIRGFKNFIRSPFNQGGRIMQLIIFPLFVGLVFYDVLDRIPVINQSSQQEMVIFLNQMVSIFYLSLFFTICQSVYDTLLVFPAQKQLILKQVHRKMYYMSIYYISKLLIQLPMMFASVIISCSTVYYVIGFQNTSASWAFYLFTFMFVALGGYMIGISTGAMCKNQLMAIQAAVLIMMPIMTFGGQSVNLRTVPWYSKWVSYLTPLRYGYNILLRDQLRGQQYHHIGDNQQIMQLLGLQYTPHQNMIQLILLTFGFTVLSFVVLYGRRKLS